MVPEKEAWYDNISDYDEKIYDHLKKLSAISSAIRYARVNGVPKESLDKFWGDSKEHKDKEKPFDINRFFLYQTLADKHPELANLVLHSMVIDELKRRW